MMSERKKVIPARASPGLPRLAMAIGELKIVIEKFVTRSLAGTEEPRIFAGKKLLCQRERNISLPL